MWRSGVVLAVMALTLAETFAEWPIRTFSREYQLVGMTDPRGFSPLLNPLIRPRRWSNGPWAVVPGPWGVERGQGPGR